MRELIERYCCREDLSTYDPYDIWKTHLGLSIKKLFNRNRYAGIIPAAVFTVFDTFLNNRLRLFYTPQEYPIVRALAALSLLRLYRSGADVRHRTFAEKHLRWLVGHRCCGYSGYSWGIGFEHAVSKDVVYDRNTPFATITPYALEAFVEFTQVTGDRQFDPVIRGILDFFHEDIRIMEETDDHLATSYGPMKDRIVINAVSYTMFACALFLPYIAQDKVEAVAERVPKLYAYIKKNQNGDGSWFYSPQGKSFIDCFHSCIVLKNLIKTNRLINLPDCASVVERGYAYIMDNLLDRQTFLFRRFSVRNKPSIVRFDLYDNAEMLSLAFLLDDRETGDRLSDSIRRHFCKGTDIYSQIVGPGMLRNRNMLRWAVMPFLYALSQTGPEECRA